MNLQIGIVYQRIKLLSVSVYRFKNCPFLSGAKTLIYRFSSRSETNISGSKSNQAVSVYTCCFAKYSGQIFN
jgi:hypothetical protein